MTPYSKLYVFLSSLFCVIIVSGNLIFQKFVGFKLFGIFIEVSVGVLLYPITFLISDLLTEFYGKKYAGFTALTAAISSSVIIAILIIAENLKATEWSNISDQEFKRIFSPYLVGSIASIFACYLAQLQDIYLFDKIKTLTRGKHLWIRNNVSTVCAQVIDTLFVLIILCSFKIIQWENFTNIFKSSMIFKIIAALLDTPFCYLGHYLISKYIKKL